MIKFLFISLCIVYCQLLLRTTKLYDILFLTSEIYGRQNTYKNVNPKISFHEISTLFTDTAQCLESMWLQRRIQSLVKHLRWNVLER